MTLLLNAAVTTAKSKAELMGDFNSRSGTGSVLNWQDKPSDKAGEKRKTGLSTTKPKMTCDTLSYKSKPDLFIANGITTTQSNVEMEGWAADINHDSVTTTMETEDKSHPTQIWVHITAQMLRNATLFDNTESRRTAWLLSLLNNTRTYTTYIDLENTYEEIKTIRVSTWKTTLHVGDRKSIGCLSCWIMYISSRKRFKAYKQVRQSSLERRWQSYETLDRKVKKKGGKKTRETLENSICALQTPDPTRPLKKNPYFSEI